MGLRDIGDTLPPGFRFYPSDEELVCHYLYKKIANEEVLRGTLVEIDLHICEPWQLPDVAKLNSNEWYFFSFRDRKYATGYRTNRATISGYWKATGKDRPVVDPRTRGIVGMRKTLVFYKNRAPNGIKTGWIMHEFRLENPNIPPKKIMSEAMTKGNFECLRWQLRKKLERNSIERFWPMFFLPPHEDWVLCRVFHKSRGENGNKLISAHNFYDSTVVATSPMNNENYASIHQNITSFNHSPSHQHHHQGSNPSTSLGLSALDPSYIDLSHDHMNEEPYFSSSHKMVDQQTTKCEDDYGFLFDFDGSNGEMQFDDDNSSVFI